MFTEVDSELVQTGPTTFRVATEAYTSPTVFAREMKRIFEGGWVYVAHESELPGPGDYKTSHIGLQPVIVSRDDSDTIHVLANRCVHRGAAVCREPRGTANLFRCPYHGWMYANDGSLVGISMKGGDAGYGESFEQPEGLQRAPRVDSYRGMIFASLNPDVMPLLDYLGRAVDVIDMKMDASPVGKIVLRSKPFTDRYRGNWKFQAENIVDGYHFSFVHEGFTHLQREYEDSTGDFGVHAGNKSPADVRRIRARGRNWGTTTGHGLTMRPVDDLEPWLNGKHGDYYRQLLAIHGEESLKRIAGRSTASIFPNVGLIHHQIRVWRPLSANLTEVTIYPYELVGAADEINQGWLRSQERFYGSAGYGQPDDAEVFAVNQQGLDASVVPWLILERGMHAQEFAPNGDFSGQPGAEVPQRAFWLGWKKRMGAEEGASE